MKGNQRFTPFKMKTVPSTPKKRKAFEFTINSNFRPSDRVFKIERKPKSEEITCQTCNGDGFLPKTHWKFKYRAHSKVAEVFTCPDCRNGKQRKITHEWVVNSGKYIVDSIVPTIKNDSVKVSYGLSCVSSTSSKYYGSSSSPMDEEFLFLHEADAVKAVLDRNNSPRNKWDDKITR